MRDNPVRSARASSLRLYHDPMLTPQQRTKTSTTSPGLVESLPAGVHLDPARFSLPAAQ